MLPRPIVRRLGAPLGALLLVPLFAAPASAAHRGNGGPGVLTYADPQGDVDLRGDAVVGLVDPRALDVTDVTIEMASSGDVTVTLEMDGIPVGPEDLGDAGMVYYEVSLFSTRATEQTFDKVGVRALFGAFGDGVRVTGYGPAWEYDPAGPCATGSDLRLVGSRVVATIDRTCLDLLPDPSTDPGLRLGWRSSFTWGGDEYRDLQTTYMPLVTSDGVPVADNEDPSDFPPPDLLDHTTACPSGSAGYTDVAGDRWAPFVDCLGRLGLVGGFPDGTFRPGLRVTRGQMAGFLVGFLEAQRGAPLPAGGSSFSDVPDSAVFAEDIDRLVGTGVVAGFTDGTYRPTTPITRAQLAQFLQRMGFSTLTGFPAPTRRWYADVKPSDTFEFPINQLADAGVSDGRGDGTYGSADPVTRGEMARFLALYHTHVCGLSSTLTLTRIPCG